MKKSNKATGKDGAKRRKRYTPFDELPEEVQKALKNMKTSYTVETVGEYIRPDVKAKLEAQKKKEE
jgi:hypothetical protein